MCWDMNEITYLKQNAQPGTMFKILGKTYVKKANEWSKVRLVCIVICTVVYIQGGLDDLQSFRRRFRSKSE